MYTKSTEQTKMLLKAGADVNAVTNGGYTALMMASIEAQKKLIRDAIMAAAAPNATTIIYLPVGTECEVKFFEETMLCETK